MSNYVRKKQQANNEFLIIHNFFNVLQHFEPSKVVPSQKLPDLHKKIWH